jgi:tRNA modification GTPase
MLAQYQQTDTIVALSTPAGMGAIGLVRLSGPEAVALVDAMFKGKLLRDTASHTAHFGVIFSLDGTLIDEVVVTLFRKPKSYTGQDVVEIACHGSPFIQQQLIERCVQAGARLAGPGEFTMRAFFNGKLDLSQAEAVGDLIAAQNAASHRIALHQMRGGFKDELAVIREQLIHFASLLELELDFSEEDVEFAPRAELKVMVQTALAHVRKLSETFRLGNAIRNGISTVIAGRPNAGKSTLLNALLNEERAIVSEIAGTTRDVIEEVLHINGVSFRLTDTAGIRQAQDSIEAIGVERTMQKMAQASIIVYVCDVYKRNPEQIVAELCEHLPVFATDTQNEHQAISLLVVCNKLDKRPDFTIQSVLEAARGKIQITENQMIAVSAHDPKQVRLLEQRIFDVGVGIQASLESTIVTNARHQEALLHTSEALTATITGLDTGITNDFLALHMRSALHHIGSITGDITVEDLLGNIFGKFCIGK